jgi:hypothetical protein
MECFIRGSRDCTQQQRVVRAKILALHCERECRVTAVHGRTNIELSDFVRHRVAVGCGMTAGEAFRSKACEDLHFKTEIRIRGSEISEVLGGDWGVFEFRHIEKIA